MREAIRGTQGPSEAIRGNQRPLHSHTSQRRTASHASHSHSHSQRRTASHASQPFRRYVATVSVNVARAASGSMKQRTSLGNRSFHGMASTASGSFLHAMREAIRDQLGNRSFHGMASTASGSFLHAMKEAIRSKLPRDGLNRLGILPACNEGGNQSPSEPIKGQSESIRVNQREAIRGTQRAVDGAIGGD